MRPLLGALHIYLLDYNGEQLSALAESLRKTFPTTKVLSSLIAFFTIKTDRFKITTMKADAASESAISSFVDRVLEEEGHLDFFFANAGISHLKDPNVSPERDLKGLVRGVGQIPVSEFNEIMRINALGWGVRRF